MAETISISLNEVPLNDSPQPTRKSVNFGPGADLLMNPNKQKKESMASDIVLDDLTELNTISLDEPVKEKKSVTTTKSNFLFSGTDFTNKPSDGNNIKLNVEPLITGDAILCFQKSSPSTWKLPIATIRQLNLSIDPSASSLTLNTKW